MIFIEKIDKLNEIYNFIVLIFSFKISKMLKNSINFQHHNNRVQADCGGINPYTLMALRGPCWRRWPSLLRQVAWTSNRSA